MGNKAGRSAAEAGTDLAARRDDDEDDDDESLIDGGLEARGEATLPIEEADVTEPEAGGGVGVTEECYPVIKVISNISTTSLKEVSTRCDQPRKPRRKRRVASVDGIVSEATTFVIYSETSSSGDSHHGKMDSSSSRHARGDAGGAIAPFIAGMDAGCAAPQVYSCASASVDSISASDSASNSAWKPGEDDVNVNQNQKAYQDDNSKIFPEGCILNSPFVWVAIAFLMTLVIVAFVIIWQTKRQ